MAEHTLADYADALKPKPLGKRWLVLGPNGVQFSTHSFDDPGLEAAAKSALQVGGTVVEHQANESTYWAGEGARYDH